MKTSSFLLLLLTTVSTAFAAGEGPEWRVGVADTVITPQGSIWMAGFASRKKPSEGVLNDLHAKALAVEDAAGSRLVIITTDLIGFPRLLRDDVAQSLRETHRLPNESLLLNCSHTHGSPVVRDDFEMPVLYVLKPDQQKAVKNYYALLRERMIPVADAALRDLRPAKIGYSSARCGFAMNRRLPTPNGYTNSPFPDGPIDHSVPVLRIETPDGKLRAVMFGYACHNTSMVGDNYRITSDYAGFAQEAIEASHKGVTALFLMGCGGDQNAYPRGTEELSRLHGRALATAVDAALLPAAQPIRGPLRAAFDDVRLKFDPMTKQELLADQASRDIYAARRAAYLLKELESKGHLLESHNCPLQVVRFGDSLTLIAFSGEAVVDYALRMKREFTNGPLWVAGYSNDVFAYVPSLRVLQEGGYEGGGAMRYSVFPGPFQKDVEETIVGKVHELLRRTQANQ